MSNLAYEYFDGIGSFEIGAGDIADRDRFFLTGVYTVMTAQIYNPLALSDAPGSGTDPDIPNPPDVPEGPVPPLWDNSVSDTCGGDTMLIVCSGGSVIGSYTKQPSEKIRFTVDYSGWLQDGETLRYASSVSDDPELVVSSAYVDTTTGSTSVIFFVSEGADGGDYKVTVKAETSGQLVERELYIYVEEV